MNIFDQIDIGKDELEKLKEEGMSEEQIQFIRYGLIGRTLASDVDIFNVENGESSIVPLFQAMLMIYMSKNVRIVTPNVRPVYNNQNKYMGFIENGKVIDVKKENKIRKIKRNFARFVGILAAFFLGLNASINITIIFIVFVIAWGYWEYDYIKDYRKW